MAATPEADGTWRGRGRPARRGATTPRSTSDHRGSLGTPKDAGVRRWTGSRLPGRVHRQGMAREPSASPFAAARRRATGGLGEGVPTRSPRRPQWHVPAVRIGAHPGPSASDGAGEPGIRAGVGGFPAGSISRCSRPTRGRQEVGGRTRGRDMWPLPWTVAPHVSSPSARPLHASGARLRRPTRVPRTRHPQTLR